MRTRIACLLAFATLALAACGDGAGELDGGVLATFDVNGETFKVWTNDEETMEQLVALDAGESEETIPNGWIERGPGPDDYNEPWSWHLEPDQVSMEESTADVCDGTPTFLEENLLEVMGTAGRFCPHDAELTGIKDYR